MITDLSLCWCLLCNYQLNCEDKTKRILFAFRGYLKYEGTDVDIIFNALGNASDI